MTFTSLLSRTAPAVLTVSLLAVGTQTSAQRSGSKSTKIDVTTIPTVPVSIVDKVAFFVHADPNFFTLDDLRRFGEDPKIKVD